jgi:hypothetical protein
MPTSGPILPRLRLAVRRRRDGDPPAGCKLAIDARNGYEPQMHSEHLLLASRALIAAAGGAIQITNLNKALFYFDLVCLRDEGEAYTGANYVALEHGPVVDHYRSVLVEGLAKSGFVEVSDQPIFQYTSTTLRNLGVVPDLGSEVRNAVAQLVGGLAGGRRAVEMSELSHRNLAWRAAIRAGEGTRIDLLVAMQQIVDHDEWFGRDLDADEQVLVAARIHEEFLPL